jgi:hypothetical protein
MLGYGLQPANFFPPPTVTRLTALSNLNPTFNGRVMGRDPIKKAVPLRF